MKTSLILSAVTISIITACSTQDALINSPEVGVYDQYVSDKTLQSILDELETRASEPKILAGEDVEGLVLASLSFFKKLGDSQSAAALSQASHRQLSALRLFVNPEYLGKGYPKTMRIIGQVQASDDWPAVRAGKDAPLGKVHAMPETGRVPRLEQSDLDRRQRSGR
jgi:hypothetical protein